MKETRREKLHDDGVIFQEVSFSWWINKVLQSDRKIVLSTAVNPLGVFF